MAGYVIHLAIGEEFIRNHPNEIKKFFDERDILDDFNKGYFVHLVTDYLFYNKFLDVFSSKYIYTDYDILNKELIKKFKVKIPDEVKEKVFYKEGKTKILDLEKTEKFIEETAKYDLNDIKKAILNNDINWLEIKKLKRI